MKVPDTNRKRALIVIDLQPAFIKPHNQHIVPNIISLIKNVPYEAYIEAIFHTEKGSLWDLQQGFTVPQDEGMQTVDEVMETLRSHNPLHVIKATRSTFKGSRPGDLLQGTRHRRDSSCRHRDSRLRTSYGI